LSLGIKLQQIEKENKEYIKYDTLEMKYDWFIDSISWSRKMSKDVKETY